MVLQFLKASTVVQKNGPPLPPSATQIITEMEVPAVTMINMAAADAKNENRGSEDGDLYHDFRWYSSDSHSSLFPVSHPSLLPAKANVSIYQL